MKPEPKLCLYCQTKLEGRTDKQFCNPYCKSAFHNKKPNSNEAFMRGINQQIRRNRSALRTACPMGKATVRKEFLNSLGMDFKYLTHTWKGQAGQIYFFCYDYGYTPVQDTDKVLIIQQQSYMQIPQLSDVLGQ